MFFGGKGAAITSSISEFLMAFLFVHFSKKDVDYRSVFSVFIKPIVSSLAMFFILEVFNFFFLDGSSLSQLWRMVLDIVLGALVYFFILIILKERLILSSIKKIFMK
jgi:hypothetical protein